MYFSCGVPSEKSEYGHGFNYTLQVFIQGKKEKTGLVISFTELDKILKKLFHQLQHKHLLFEIPYFKKKNPSLLNLAKFCFKELKSSTLWDSRKNVKLEKIRLYQGSDFWVDLFA